MDTRVRISVFNSSGWLVQIIYNGYQPAGSYHVFWNGMNDNGLKMGSGTYIIRMVTEDTQQVQKVMLLK